MIYFFVICVGLVLIINYFINNSEPIAPSVLFTTGFFLMSIFAAINAKKWDFELDTNTFILVLGSIVEFSICCWCSKKFFQRNVTTDSKDFNISIIKSRKLLLFFVVLFNLLYVLLEIRRKTGITNPIMAANYLNASSRRLNNTLSLSGRASIATLANISICLWSEWNFSKILFMRKKIDYGLLGIILISILTPLLNGGRNDTITCFISLYIFLYFAFKLKYGNANRSKNKKFLVISVISIIIGLVILPWTATVVGRNVSQYSSFDYVSIYIGAELKNLSVFIQNSVFPVDTSVWGSHTFYALIPVISSWFGLDIPRYLVYLPFQYVNGYNLGNVYTIFYPWLYDFGYIGVIVMTFFVALISQYIYTRGKEGIGDNRSIYPLLYGYFGAFIFLSFFADNLIQKISLNLIYIIIIWIILNHFLFKKSKDKVVN